MKHIFLPTIITFLLSLPSHAQTIEKISFDTSDSTSGYYLAMPPSSGSSKGVLVLFCPYRGAESMLPETRLHNVAAANDLLTIYASVGRNIVPDEKAIKHLDKVFADVAARYKTDTSLFAVGGFDDAGMTVLRYAELAQESPNSYSIHPKVLFAVASYVDLAGYYNVCQRQIKKNFYPPVVGDARSILAMLDKGEGSPSEHPDHYASLSPFSTAATEPGNEKYLRHKALRLYYDTDMDWQLKTRRNSYYDTWLPDGAELIDRLLLQGNRKAEFIATRPGMRSNGVRHTTALSIVDEVDCVQWIKKELHIFSPGNPFAYVAPYTFQVPDGWRIERTAFPPPFAPDIKLHGIEEIRFPAGWGVAGSEDYWSLAYLFWLDAGQKIDEDVLKEMLKTYYDGLVITGGGPVPHNIPKDKMVETKVHIRKITTEPDDLATYAGTVEMLDYMAMKPITLNYKAHTKACNSKDHFPLFLELSPRPFEDVIWNNLEYMKKRFIYDE